MTIAIAAAALGLLFTLFLVLVLFFYNPLQLQRTRRNYFVVGAAFRARDHFAFVHLVFFNVQVGIAFRTKHHMTSDHLRRISFARVCMSRCPGEQPCLYIYW